ncbi:MAG: HAD hydrolase family protein [Lachnospiraceae bacterium]|nr:HAD hydrolase family protein [Lachnospiraceae bacterium]
MRLAIISDIHGNFPALSAVLADAAAQGAEEYIFAGDYCLSGPYINECIDAIRAYPDAIVIRGNEEAYLENLIGRNEREWTDGQMQISYFTFRTISKDNLDYLMALPHRCDIDVNGVAVHIAHFPPEKTEELADGVYIFGHTHKQWSSREEGGRVTLVNPGSCGLPLEGVPGTVPYTMLEITEDGEVIVNERRVPFDAISYAKSLTNTRQYEQATVWTKVIQKELVTATEHLQPFLMSMAEYANRIGDARRPFAVDTWEAGYAHWNRTTLPYRAIIVDLDRTLLRTDKTISETTKNALRDWQESGAEVFIASARPERAITEYRDTLGVTSYVTLNGARTITPQGTIENEIPTDSAFAIINQLAEIPGTVISIEAAGGLYANVDIPIWQPIVTDRLADVAKREGVYKVIASHPDLTPEELVLAAGEIPQDVYHTIADRKLVQFMSRTATKWNGIQAMLAAAGIPAEQAIYFGDDHDDIEPIVRCGLGVAVANALPQVKEKADDIAATNDEDGVAAYLRRLENGPFCE